ncbi:hypothetical protein HQQ80_13340 [Microbacteriaceae bacterium VKM Ac-2855]|nr:hypothetical protein [Microbacteriaceae bacterium VKM Ac-2855]
MAIIDRPNKKKGGAAPSAPKSARVEHSFDSSIEEWLAEISAQAAAAELARLEHEGTAFRVEPVVEADEAECALDPEAPLLLNPAAHVVLAETTGAAPVIGEVCALDEIVLENPAAAAFVPIEAPPRDSRPVATPAAPREPRPVEPPLSRRRVLGNWAIGVGAIAVAAVLVVIGLPRSSDPIAPLPVSADPAIASAETWIAGNVAGDSRVLVDDDLSAELVAAGLPSDAILPLSLLAADADPEAWRSADFVLASPDVRNDTAATVTAALANSTVVAGFGDVEVRRIRSTGLDPAADAAAVTARAALGAQLASNPEIALAAPAAAALQAGQVDGRIIVVLGEALADRALGVADMPVGAGESDGPRHRLLLNTFDGAPLATDATAVAEATAWLEGLSGDYAPLSVTSGPDGVLATFSVGDPSRALPAN